MVVTTSIITTMHNIWRACTIRLWLCTTSTSKTKMWKKPSRKSSLKRCLKTTRLRSKSSCSDLLSWRRWRRRTQLKVYWNWWRKWTILLTNILICHTWPPSLLTLVSQNLLQNHVRLKASFQLLSVVRSHPLRRYWKSKLPRQLWLSRTVLRT